MTEFTEGPWTRDKSGNIYGKDRRFICSANGSMSNIDWEEHQAENDANGDIILAAPDMYEALVEIIKVTPMVTAEVRSAVMKANAAISKADGK